MWLQVIFVTILSHFLSADAKSMSPKCTRPAITWKIDWSKQPTDLGIFNEVFQYPGEIVSGTHVDDVLKLLGLAWNAKSFLEVNGLICLQYGPILNVLAGHDMVREECDDIMIALSKENNYDLEGLCNAEWNALYPVQMVQYAIPYYGCYDNFTCQFDPLITAYSRDIIEKASELVFHVLNWLGPSPFSGDVFGACSALRQFLAMNINDIATGSKSILTFPIADILEYFKELSPCRSEEYLVVAMRDILIILSDMDRSSFCSFISGRHTREEYLDLGSIIVNNLFYVPVDVTRCIDALDVISSIIDSNIIYQITGYDITLPSQRRVLCAQTTESLSQSSTFTPSSYILPFRFNFDSWLPFSTPGEILPNFFFNDAVDVIGAVFRSQTLIQGASVLCIEFESAVYANSVEVGSYVRDTCRAIRDGNTAEIERDCLEMTVPLQYWETYPISVRVPTSMYMAVIGVDVARQLFNFTKISQSKVCMALDDFYHSNNNLQSVVRLSLNSYLAECLPIADNICKDYTNVVWSFGGGCYNRRYQKRFEETVNDISQVGFAILGVSNRCELCNQISSGIDSSSGAANEDLVSEIESDLLFLFINNERCVNVVDISLEMAQKNFRDVNIQDQLYMYTGYRGSKDLCTNLTSAFKCNEDLSTEKSVTEYMSMKNTEKSLASSMQISCLFVICVPFFNFVKMYIFGP